MSSYNFDVIFTINARDNVILGVITDYFNLSEQRVYREITSSLKLLKMALEKKNINYLDLKRALVPNVDRNEIAFVFDWSNIESSLYGKEVIENMLPLFDSRSIHSVLCGDWIYAGEHNTWLCDELATNLISSSKRYKGQWDNLYFVYINNLSDSMVNALDQGLNVHPAYLGYLDLRFMSAIKTYLSTLLARAFIKHKNIIIQGHEDDRSEIEDVNISLYDFIKFGYVVRSIPSCLYDIFLSYKIERPVFQQSDRDTRFSLNAISNQPIELEQFDIVLDKKKLEYLQNNKANSLKRADLHCLTSSQIADHIRQKIKANYIYNLAKSDNGKTMKFNVILENSDIARNVCSLKYLPSERVLKLITFY